MHAYLSRRRQLANGEQDGEWRTMLAPRSGSMIDARSPETRLLLAVLADAVDAFQKNAFASSRKSRRLFVEAEEWFASDAADSPLAFVTICHALGLDVSYLRSGLRRWRERAEQARLEAVAVPGHHPSAA
jgi:hypothetical protein